MEMTFTFTEDGTVTIEIDKVRMVLTRA